METLEKQSGAPSDSVWSEKPALRGYLHLVGAPIFFFAILALVIIEPNRWYRLALGVYLACIVSMFGISSVLHRVNFRKKRVEKIVQRMDHTAIFFGIAGTYTPVVALALRGNLRIGLLVGVWVGAGVGVLIRLFFLNAPRFFVVTPYVIVGWLAIIALPELLNYMGVATFSLILAGGIFYSLGAVSYAIKKPNFNPKIFGFHEWFHLMTVLGATSHYLAVLTLVVRSS